MSRRPVRGGVPRAPLGDTAAPVGRHDRLHPQQGAAPCVRGRGTWAAAPLTGRGLVWRLLKDVQAEDATVTAIKAYTADGAALADSTPVGHVLQGPFQLSVNGDLYVLNPSADGPCVRPSPSPFAYLPARPPHTVAKAATAAVMPELRELVEQLHAALHTRETTRAKLAEEERTLAALRADLAPLVVPYYARPPGSSAPLLAAARGRGWIEVLRWTGPARSRCLLPQVSYFHSYYLLLRRRRSGSSARTRRSARRRWPRGAAWRTTACSGASLPGLRGGTTRGT